MFNDCGNFRDQWVNLTTMPTHCVFTGGLDRIELPVRHAEGKFFADPEVLETLNENGQVVFRYSLPDGRPADGAFPSNPNGSLSDIAGICDRSGRILGLMPHPEGSIFITQHPDWTIRKEELLRSGEDLPLTGDGMRIFTNAVDAIRGAFC